MSGVTEKFLRYVKVDTESVQVLCINPICRPNEKIMVR